MQGGQPCRRCGGRGPGMGRRGQGRGGLAPQEQTAVTFRTERAKVHSGRGAIIGQFLIDGEQVKGDVSSTFGEAVSAAEREASDLIHRDRIPRQYHKAVKAYFSNLQRAAKGSQAGEANSPPGEAADPSDGKSDQGSAAASPEDGAGE